MFHLQKVFSKLRPEMSTKGIRTTVFCPFTRFVQDSERAGFESDNLFPLGVSVVGIAHVIG